MIYDSKNSKSRPDSGHKGYDYYGSKSHPDSSQKGYYSGGSKEKTSSSEPNQTKFLQDYEIRCVYKINMTNYYRNVNIYNYKKRIII
jgi:hypothetical protein